MSKVYITVGIPGSGKSTWAQSNKGKLFSEVFSSDEYRKKLFSDENTQEHNALVFLTLFNDVTKAVKSGIDICFDATNVKKSDRVKFLKHIESLAGVTKIAVVFRTALETAKIRNKQRERVVPDEVIERMHNKLIEPTQEEGFDDIIIVKEESI